MNRSQYFPFFFQIVHRNSASQSVSQSSLMRSGPFHLVVSS